MKASGVHDMAARCPVAPAQGLYEDASVIGTPCYVRTGPRPVAETAWRLVQAHFPRSAR